MSLGTSDEAVRCTRTIDILDVLFAAVFCAFAVSLRRNLPSDGLFYDDAWQAFGAVKGSFSQLYTVGQSQPGFTFVMMVWSRLFGDSPASILTPALVAGSVGPPALYLALRRFRYARATALLVGAMLTATTTHIVFSTHAKSYTTDVLVVLALAVLLPLFAERQWGVGTAVAWVVCALVFSCVAAIAPIATIAAGLTLAVHPRADRTVRGWAVGVQLAATGMYVVAVLRTYNDKLVRSFWSTGDAFIRASLNPLHFVRTIFEHLVRVALVFPGGRTLAAVVALALAAAGLAWSAWRGTRVVVARFLILMTVLAFIGALIHRVPFGPKATGTFGRITLWLVPVMAFGLAAVFDYARAKLADHKTARSAFDGLVIACAGLVLLSAAGHSHPYTGSGGRLVTHSVMARLRSREAVWISSEMAYSFALYANTRVRVRATPREEVGFQPQFADPRLHLLGLSPTSRELTTTVRNIDIVYVVLSRPRQRTSPDFVAQNQYRSRLAGILTSFHFAPMSAIQLGTAELDTWVRTTP